MGQKLQGDFVFERKTVSSQTVVELKVTNFYVGLGDGTTDFVSVSGGLATLIVDSTGLTGSFSGTVKTNIPQVAFTGAFTVDVRIDRANAASRYLRVTGTGVSLTVAGQELKGNFAIEQTATATGATTVRVGVTGLLLAFGEPANPFVRISNGSGMMLIGAQGMAASFSVNPSFNLTGVSLSGGTVTLDINTGTVAVKESIVVSGSTVTIDVPAGPFVKVTAIGAKLQVGGAELNGDFCIRSDDKGRRG